MSEMKAYRGKLVLVDKVGNETLEEQCKRLLNVEKMEDYYISYAEQLCDTKPYVTYKDELYKILEKKELDPYDSRFNGSVNEDGSIDFDVNYYNGGCSLSDALYYVLKDVKSNSQHEIKYKSKAKYYKSKMESLIEQAINDGVIFTTEQVAFFNSVYMNIHDEDNNKETVRLCELSKHTITKVGE